MTTKISALEKDTETWVFIQTRGKGDRLDLLQMTFPEIDGTKGLIIFCGKIPYWLAAPVISHYRNRCKWQAIKESGKPVAIVTTSFDPDTPVASEIPVEMNCLVCDLSLRSDAIYPYCENHKNHAPERQTYQKKKKQ